MKNLDVEVCVIGAGSGGLSVASGTAQLGLSTVLLERAEMGGDCLNTGCVPSKALLSAGKSDLEFAAGKKYVQAAIDHIAPHDSQERFEGFGIQVIRDSGSFVDANTVQTKDFKIRAKYFVVATGSHAVTPPISGLDTIKTHVYTNESIFALTDKPDHLVIIGGGPIGLEMAQAHRNFGCPVTIIDIGRIFPQGDAEAVTVLRAGLESDGIRIIEHAKDLSFAKTATGISVNVSGETLTASHVLVAAGRKPNIADLNLTAANIEHTPKGITVTDRLRSTTNPNVFAVGDVTGHPQFTHVAGYHAGIIIRNICFRMPAKVDYSALPYAIYTNPELAQVGLTEDAAHQKYGEAVQSFRAEFSGNDRAVTEDDKNGFCKLIVYKGRVIGGTVVGSHAGELIATIGLAIQSKMKLSQLAGAFIAYPTRSEIIKRAAGSAFTPKLFNPKMRKIIRILQKFPLF